MGTERSLSVDLSLFVVSEQWKEGKKLVNSREMEAHPEGAGRLDNGALGGPQRRAEYRMMGIDLSLEKTEYSKNLVNSWKA